MATALALWPGVYRSALYPSVAMPSTLTVERIPTPVHEASPGRDWPTFALVVGLLGHHATREDDLEASLATHDFYRGVM